MHSDVGFVDREVHIFKLYNTMKIIQLTIENSGFVKWYISNDSIDDMSSYTEEEKFQKTLV